MKLLSVAFLVLVHSVTFTNAFFQHMFQQQQQPQQRPVGHSAQMWQHQADAVDCSEYLCPSTLVCVSKPTDCPCPHPQDVKCVIQDEQSKKTSAGTVMCISGASGCDVLDRFSKW
ncbi:hypothetical protein DL93DRAFT_1785219 [Clavulina sp. PMI_390]|nr:hypothetical protein DL93DRAFT_1785219 [Clavulina sp. PMI_390]